MRKVVASRDSVARVHYAYGFSWRSVSKAKIHAALGETDSLMAELGGSIKRDGKIAFTILSPCVAPMLKDQRVRDLLTRLGEGR